METYEAPKMEVIRFENEDIITSSLCGCTAEGQFVNGG